jgi:hypothetical protein
VAAAREFGLTKETLARKLNQSGQVPGADKRYSTEQIIAAIFGDIASKRLRKTGGRGRQLGAQKCRPAGRELAARALLTPALTEIFTIVA